MAMDAPDRLRRDLEVARATRVVARQIDLGVAAEAFVRVAMEHGQASAGFLYLYEGEHDIFHEAPGRSCRSLA